jgi:hypothetical protein
MVGGYAGHSIILGHHRINVIFEISDVRYILAFDI